MSSKGAGRLRSKSLTDRTLRFGTASQRTFSGNGVVISCLRIFSNYLTLIHVYRRAKDSRTDQPVAVKNLRVSAQLESAKRALREVEMLKHFVGSNNVRILEEIPFIKAVNGLAYFPKLFYTHVLTFWRYHSSSRILNDLDSSNTGYCHHTWHLYRRGGDLYR